MPILPYNACMPEAPHPSDGFYCPQCQAECAQPLVCGDCQAVICNRCGAVLEEIDDLGIG